MRNLGGKALSLLSLLLLLLSGCSKPTPINELLKQPNRWKDKEVLIQGKVIFSISLPTITQKSFYRVDDGTGVILVSTLTGAPEQNRTVRVKGKFRYPLPVTEGAKIPPPLEGALKEALANIPGLEEEERKYIQD